MSNQAIENIIKPIQKLNFHTEKPLNNSETYIRNLVLKSALCHQATSEEYDANAPSGTWELVPPDNITNLVINGFILLKEILMVLLTYLKLDLWPTASSKSECGLP